VKPGEFVLAAVTAIGLVVFIPVWTAFVDLAGLTGQTLWVVSLLLPALVTLFAVSWIRPSMTTPVLGLFVLAAFMTGIAPQLWEIMELGAGAAPTGGLTGPVLTLLPPLLALTYVMALGWRRLTAQ